MKSPHAAASGLGRDKDSSARWALNPDGILIIFVHGFGGSPGGTWKDFPRILPTRPELAGTDLFFYSYDGTRTRAGVSAALFRELLNEIASSAATANQTLPTASKRQDPWAYKRIVIVAHSLGAIVARSALLDAHLGKKTWAPATRMVLFAPAHKGADVIGLAVENTFLGSITRPLLSVVLFHWDVLRDLEPGSPLLATLEANITNEPTSASYLLAFDTIHAERENLVVPARFSRDPPFRVFLDRTHIDVCKPTTGYLDPIDAVITAVTAA